MDRNKFEGKYMHVLRSTLHLMWGSGIQHRCRVVHLLLISYKANLNIRIEFRYSEDKENLAYLCLIDNNITFDLGLAAVQVLSSVTMCRFT